MDPFETELLLREMVMNTYSQEKIDMFDKRVNEEENILRLVEFTAGILLAIYRKGSTVIKKDEGITFHVIRVDDLVLTYETENFGDIEHVIDFEVQRISNELINIAKLDMENAIFDMKIIVEMAKDINLDCPEFIEYNKSKLFYQSIRYK